MRKLLGFWVAKDQDVTTSVEMPSDPLHENLSDITEFAAFLSSMEQCGEALLDALTKLQTAPTPLLDCLSTSHSQDYAGGELLENLSVQLNACIYRLTRGMPHLEEMIQRVKKVKPHVKAAQENIAKREAAWNIKVRCDTDHAALKQKGTGPVFSLDKRQKRLKAHHEADVEFNRISDVVSKQCDEILYNRWSNTAAALTDLCHCYAEIFEAPPKLAGDLLKSAAKLTSTSRNFEEPPEREDTEGNENNDDECPDFILSPTGQSASPPENPGTVGAPQPASSLPQASKNTNASPLACAQPLILAGIFTGSPPPLASTKLDSPTLDSTSVSPQQEQEPPTGSGKISNKDTKETPDTESGPQPLSTKYHFAKGDNV